MTDTLHDKPLSPGYSVPLETLDEMGLRTGNSAHNRARAAIVGQLVSMRNRQDERHISYSRNKAWYAAPQAKYLQGTDLTYATVPAGVDALEKAGIIEHEKAEARAHGTGWQSRFKLLETSGALPDVVRVKQVGPTLVLRNDDGVPLPLPNTDAVWRMQRQLDRINEALRGVRIGGPHVLDQVVHCGDGRRIWVGDIRLRRVFNEGRMDRGGRAYDCYQNVPSVIRSTFTLNGKPVLSHDYKCLHPRLAYAEVGIIVPDGVDLYDIGSSEWEPKKIVKPALNILINAPERRAAHASICRRIAVAHGDPAAENTERGTKFERNRAWQHLVRAYGEEANRLIDAIIARHRPIEAAFGSGAGLRFQAIDAAIVLTLASRLLTKADIPCLPVHDEIIAPAWYFDRLKADMNEALHNRMNILSGRSRRSTGFSAEICGFEDATVLHSGSVASPVPGVPALILSPASLDVVLSRALFETDFSGGPRLASGGLFPIDLTTDLPGWAGGRLPLSVRAAVLHETKARGMTQDQLAARLGISRPQLTNALRGRFGLGKQAANKLREFLSC